MSLWAYQIYSKIYQKFSKTFPFCGISKWLATLAVFTAFLKRKPFCCLKLLLVDCIYKYELCSCLFIYLKLYYNRVQRVDLMPRHFLSVPKHMFWQRVGMLTIVLHMIIIYLSYDPKLYSKSIHPNTYVLVYASQLYFDDIDIWHSIVPIVTVLMCVIAYRINF